VPPRSLIGHYERNRKITVKTTENTTEAATSVAPELPFNFSNMPRLPVKSKPSLIQWATEQQIQEVSKQLAAINQVAIHSEVNGDYFTSGDLAYQIREIIRATAQLFKKCQRAKEKVMSG